MNYCTRTVSGEVVSNIYRKPIRLSDGDKEVLSGSIRSNRAETRSNRDMNLMSGAG